MHRIVDELSDYYVYEIDIDQQHEIATGLKVSSVPTMIVFEDGGTHTLRRHHLEREVGRQAEDQG